MKTSEIRYDFGRNWHEYSNQLDDNAIQSAIHGMYKLLGKLNGKRFLDIGSGSGIHSLAAIRLGAKEVRCIDYDNNSVETTKRLLAKYAGDCDWRVRQGDILLETSESDDVYDVVYSWGVLHHTGNVWKAIDNAATFVKQGGYFVIALYLKTPFCNLWANEKLIYSNYPILRPFIRYPYIILLLLRLWFRGIPPWNLSKIYKKSRGMSFMHDVDDWLGGYPYQSVSDDEVISYMHSHGFELLSKYNVKIPIGIFGTGCGEWVFKREYYQ